MNANVRAIMGLHIATLNAYEIAESKGGGFRGVIFLRETKERIASDRLDTLEEARYWAQTQAHERFDAQGYALAPVRKRGEYLANVWVR